MIISPYTDCKKERKRTFPPTVTAKIKERERERKKESISPYSDCKKERKREKKRAFPVLELDQPPYDYSNVVLFSFTIKKLQKLVLRGSSESEGNKGSVETFHHNKTWKMRNPLNFLNSAENDECTETLTLKKFWKMRNRGFFQSRQQMGSAR